MEKRLFSTYVLFSLLACSIGISLFSKMSAEIGLNALTIQPIADTYVDSTYHWQNKGSSDILAVWNGTTKYISFLNFNLSGLDSKEIVSAVLFLCVVESSVESNEASIIGAHFYNESWNENELTWDTVNWSSLNETAIDTTEIYLDLLEYQVWFNWTITQDVQNSKGDFLTEAVRAENNIESIIFSSKDLPTPYLGHEPYLNITYIESSVGGIYIPIHKLQLLAPYIGLTILLAVAAMTVAYVKKRKRELK